MLIFAKGDIRSLTKPCLGFCGSRKASEKGLKTAWDFADQMARKGVNIISGYASGVDMTAHKAALEAGGTTTLIFNSVWGSALDIGHIWVRKKIDLDDYISRLETEGKEDNLEELKKSRKMSIT